MIITDEMREILLKALEELKDSYEVMQEGAVSNRAMHFASTRMATTTLLIDAVKDAKEIT